VSAGRRERAKMIASTDEKPRELCVREICASVEECITAAVSAAAEDASRLVRFRERSLSNGGVEARPVTRELARSPRRGVPSRRREVRCCIEGRLKLRRGRQREGRGGQESMSGWWNGAGGYAEMSDA
jgi:hypothetical protein